MKSIFLYGTLIGVALSQDPVYEPPPDPLPDAYESEPLPVYGEPVDAYGGSEPLPDAYGSEPLPAYGSEPLPDAYGSEPLPAYGSEPLPDAYGAPIDSGYGAPIDSGYGAPVDAYGSEPLPDAYGAPVDAYAPPDYSTPPAPQVIYNPLPKTWADAQAWCVERGSNLLSIDGGNFQAMADCAAQSQGITWTGLNRLGDDGYGNAPWELVSGQPFAGADAYGEAVTLSDGYGDGNCAYMKADLMVQNTAQMCDVEFPSCCDPVSEAYPAAMVNGYDGGGLPDMGNVGPVYQGPGTPIGGSDYQGPSPPNNVNADCPRIRREWNTATDEERATYIEAILELSRQGILQKFVQQHSHMVSDRQAHGTSAFLPWHRAFLFEFEEHIRRLGGKFECTALLYWNWAKDVETYGFQYTSYSILTSGLGGAGDPLDNYCVNSGAFTKDVYTPYYCLDGWASTAEGSEGTCCLRRNPTNNGMSSSIAGIAQMLNAIISDPYYGIDADREFTYINGRMVASEILDGIRDNLEKGPHDVSHCTMGGCRSSPVDLRGHLGSSNSPDDPIFWLLHSFVDYAWALWQDFYEFEIMHQDYLTEDAFAGQIDGISGPDDYMSFEILNAQPPLTRDGSAFLSYINPTLRLREVHSITEMGFQYHIGTFIPDSHIYTCGLNSEWFVGVMPDCSGPQPTLQPTFPPYDGPGDSYGAPPVDNYGEPPADSYGSPPADSYGAPPADNYGAEPCVDEYGAPCDLAPVSYGEPVDYPHPDAPCDSYGGVPCDSGYGAPQPDAYGAPPQDAYGMDSGYALPPPDTNAYGAPPCVDEYGAPCDLAPVSYGEPVDYPHPDAPCDSYGGVPCDNSYGAPIDSGYGAPIDSGYGSEPSPFLFGSPDNNYGGEPVDVYMPLDSSYGPPVIDYGAMGDAYGAPIDSYSAPAPPMDAYGGQSTNDLLYNALLPQYGERAYTIEGKQEMTATRAKMECEYRNTGPTACSRPQFFYNCCDLPRDGNDYGDYPDIAVTLEQLLEWAPNDCMKETRKQMFGWAQSFGSLYRLCRGDYDNFCDSDFLQGSYGDTCVTLEQYNSDPAYGNNIISAQNGPISVDPQQPIISPDNSGKFNQLEAMVLNGVVNGIIFSIIIVLFMTIYVCYKRYYNGPYTKVKYADANDVEN